MESFHQDRPDPDKGGSIQAPLCPCPGQVWTNESCPEHVPIVPEDLTRRWSDPLSPRYQRFGWIASAPSSSPWSSVRVSRYVPGDFWRFAADRPGQVQLSRWWLGRVRSEGVAEVVRLPVV